MGGTTRLLLPVGERRMSSWDAHQLRYPTPSSEPGTDWYCPIGTPVLAPADGRIYGYGNSIGPATGRWIGIEFDNGMSFRAMHFSKLSLSSATLNNGGRVAEGTTIALSGASGYGEEDWSWNVAQTGGAHVHGTLWPDHDRRFGYRYVNGVKLPFTIDFMNFAKAAGGGSTTPIEMDQDMTLEFVTVAAAAGGGIDGNDNPGWAVLNTAKPNLAPVMRNGLLYANPVIIRASDANAQESANSWARSLGRSARSISRQDWLNLIELNRLTHG